MHRQPYKQQCVLAPAAMAALLALTALPGQAADFIPPQGCKLEMTVQNRGCTVSQHYRCTADTSGDQRVTIYTPDGPVYESRIDRETRWMESTNLVQGMTDILVDQADDHASFSTLMKTGRDDFDFWTLSSDGQRLHHVGYDELPGDKVSIDGVPLEVTRFELTTYSESGDVLIERKGQQFISRAHGRFYGGIEHSTDWTGAVQETNDSPVTFAFPGQPGFGATRPEYDCDLQMVGGQPASPILQQLMDLKEARI
ncbi:hypothetical protein [Paracoccus sp. (in: a-proteobacteria)]|uniref:hypothetical protein n=1 Tax=Paracoccus sp. TaxID=267 RepID=UPI0035AEF778